MYAELKRTCKRCGIFKEVRLFTSGGNSASAISRAKNFCHECQKEEARNRAAKFRIAHPEKIRGNKLKCLYGITLKEYEAKAAAQNQVCAICKKPQNRKNGVTGKQENLVVDHNHTTKQVRDLLCHKCNLSVGIVEKNLQPIQDYLDKFKKAG